MLSTEVVETINVNRNRTTLHQNVCRAMAAHGYTHVTSWVWERNGKYFKPEPSDGHGWEVYEISTGPMSKWFRHSYPARKDIYDAHDHRVVRITTDRGPITLKMPSNALAWRYAGRVFDAGWITDANEFARFILNDPDRIEFSEPVLSVLERDKGNRS